MNKVFIGITKNGKKEGMIIDVNNQIEEITELDGEIILFPSARTLSTWLAN